MANNANTSAEIPDAMTPPQGDYVYRDQKGRYPWWVRSVDRITTEVDESIEVRLGRGQCREVCSKQNEYTPREI